MCSTEALDFKTTPLKLQTLNSRTLFFTPNLEGHGDLITRGLGFRVQGIGLTWRVMGT